MTVRMSGAKGTGQGDSKVKAKESVFTDGLTRRRAMGALAFAAVGSVRCRQRDEPVAAPAYHFAFVTNNSSEFWNIATKGVQKAERELRIKVEVFHPLRGQVSEQVRYLENILLLNFDGIPVSPVNADELTPRSTGWPSACLSFATTRTRLVPSGGRTSVRTMSKRVAPQRKPRSVRWVPLAPVKWGLFVGSRDMQNAVQRTQGLLEVLSGSGLEVLPTFLDNADRAKAKSNVEDALSRYPDLVLLIGLWSYNGAILAEAVRLSSRDPKPIVIAFDQETETLRAIDSGLIHATIAQKPFEFGYQSMKLLKDAKDGKVVPAVVDTGFTTVQKGNLVEYLDQMTE